MALSKGGSALVTSQSSAAGGTVNGPWTSTGYGVSGEVTVTNGSTGPNAGCVAYVQLADDASGTNARPYRTIGGPGTVASASLTLGFGLALGAGADAPYYRVQFTGHTGQPVTVEAYAWSTSSIY